LSAMQSRRVGLARMIGAAALVCCLSFVSPALSADPLEDLWLKLAVKTALSLDPYLRVLPITIAVEEGIVTVSGHVALPMQKRLAMRRIGATVDSGSVIDRLVIGRGDPGGQPSERVDARVLRDAKLALAVRRKLKEGSGVTVRALRVAASDGGVTLNGEVNTAADKDEAGRRADEVDGVFHVTNNLRLPGEAPSTDRQGLPDRGWKGKLYDKTTLLRARRALARNSNLAPYRIKVEVRDGIVTLRGEVPDEEKVALAEHLITDLTGIAGVVNELRVKQ
jgi:osmotically-inducible protein OsmY